MLASVGGIAILPGTAPGVAGKTTATGTDERGGNDGRNGDTPGEQNDRDEYPRVDDVPDEPIAEYATQVAMHPNQRRAALTTARFGDGFQLYVVQRVQDSTSVADTAWRITETDGIVAGMEWTVDNRLRYDVNFTRYERKLPPSHKQFEPDVIEEFSLQGVSL